MTQHPPDIELQPSDLFLNRELSLLEFNRRVLAQALDDSVPLLERLRFLCISSANLDEFFEIRVAGLQQMAELNPGNRGSDGLTPAEMLAAISTRAHAVVDEQYRVFNDVLIPALDREKVRFLRRSEWTPEQDAWLRRYFLNELMPVLSPLGLDPAHPFPRILNKSLNFVVQLSGKDAFGRNTGIAIVQAPRALPRLIQIPAEVAGSGPHDFVFLSSVIHAYVDDLFPGMEAGGCYQFRLTRNSDLLVDEEEAKDLMEALEGELSQRQWGDIVRLEVAHNCPEHMWRYLTEVAQLTEADVYQVNGPVNLHRLMAVPDMVDRADLKFPPFTPSLPKSLGGDLFAAIRDKDRLLHHPYDSFMPVVDLLRQAARDPKVLAIKQTLYRTGDQSAVVDALMEAAGNGKEVTVVVELRARFDEANNIDLAEKLQDIGAHVVYGVVGYKTHAKMCLIVRREEGIAQDGGVGLRYYAHLGTGNYHPRTARIYTDYGLMTANPEICSDVHTVFLQLTSLGKVTKLARLLQSPFTLAKGMHAKIEREIAHARAGKPAQIIAKMNSLVEPEIIKALYQASNAGVKIELIVRGMCSLRPGVKGLSENIRVRSVIGRFLEHHRVFYFANNGDGELYLSSADWMERNLFRRVEVAFPILDKKLRERVLKDLGDYLNDSAQSWLLQSDGNYVRPEHIEGKGVQQRLMEGA